MTHPYSIDFVECLHTTRQDLCRFSNDLAIASRTFAQTYNTVEATQSFPLHSPKLVGVPGNAPGRER